MEIGIALIIVMSGVALFGLIWAVSKLRKL